VLHRDGEILGHWSSSSPGAVGPVTLIYTSRGPTCNLAEAHAGFFTPRPITMGVGWYVTGGPMGTKDKGGGKASKKAAQKSLKEKRQAKKMKSSASRMLGAR